MCFGVSDVFMVKGHSHCEAERNSDTSPRSSGTFLALSTSKNWTPKIVLLACELGCFHLTMYEWYANGTLAYGWDFDRISSAALRLLFWKGRPLSSACEFTGSWSAVAQKIYARKSAAFHHFSEGRRQRPEVLSQTPRFKSGREQHQIYLQCLSEVSKQ